MARKVSTRQSNAPIPVVIGAGITEQWYFYHLHDILNVQLRIRPRYFGSEDIHQLDKKISQVVNEGATAICVFDADTAQVDEVQRQRIAALKAKYAGKKNVILCDSLPSIEFWFLIHYLDTSPLARAEWMRFYGRLFGVGANADSLFTQVLNNYQSLCDLAARTPLRPKVMLDTKSGSAWYVAGGNSTIGQMIADAGGTYIFAENKNSGSVPLSFETVFEKAKDADVWLLKNSSTNRLTYKLLESDFKQYSSFKPFKERNIWACDVYQVPYFELTAFHPEILLADFMAIFHPELSHARTFYHPLDE